MQMVWDVAAPSRYTEEHEDKPPKDEQGPAGEIPRVTGEAVMEGICR
jgi:hypothetical protein